MYLHRLTEHKYEQWHKSWSNMQAPDPTHLLERHSVNVGKLMHIFQRNKTQEIMQDWNCQPRSKQQLGGRSNQLLNFARKQSPIKWYKSRFWIQHVTQTIYADASVCSGCHLKEYRIRSYLRKHACLSVLKTGKPWIQHVIQRVSRKITRLVKTIAKYTDN